MTSTWNIRTGLKKAREERGLSQSDLAKSAGLQPSFISHIETGNRVPTLGNLIRIADALNIGLDTLLGRADFQQEYTPHGAVVMRAMRKMSIPDRNAFVHLAGMISRKQGAQMVGCPALD